MIKRLLIDDPTESKRFFAAIFSCNRSNSTILVGDVDTSSAKNRQTSNCDIDGLH